MNTDLAIAKPSLDDRVSELRVLVASDPKRARTAFLEILETCERDVELLRLLSGPGDGRLRQMVATVFRAGKHMVLLQPWLEQWIQLEPDEFTKNAIASALALHSPKPESNTQNVLHVSDAVVSYRYVADRLCHRVRNAMANPSAQIFRLESVIGRITDPAVKSDLVTILGGLESGFDRISRCVAFETRDDYLTWQSISLVSWLDRADIDFIGQYGHATQSITCDPVVRQARIHASRFLLDTIFGNVWTNAIQAVAGSCHIEFQCSVDPQANNLFITVIDNGNGFDQQDMDTAFLQMYSSKSRHRGRGLLEIADGVNRLQGNVRLVPDGQGLIRLQIRLPMEYA